MTRFVSKHELYINIQKILHQNKCKDETPNTPMPLAHLTYLVCSRNFSIDRRSIHMLTCQERSLENYVPYTIPTFHYGHWWMDSCHTSTYLPTYFCPNLPYRPYPVPRISYCVLKKVLQCIQSF